MTRTARGAVLGAVVAAAAVAATLGGVALTTGFGTVALPPAAAGPGTRRVAGPPVLRLDAGAMGAGGITLSALRAAPFRPVARRYAQVVDPAPLFALDGRIAAAQAGLVAARAKARLSRQEYARDRALFAHHQSVSEQALMAAQAAQETDAQAEVQARAARDDLRASLRARFGAAFLGAGSVGGAGSGAGGAGLIARLRDGAAALVSVSLPGAEEGAPAERITLVDAGGRTIAARHLSDAPAGTAGAAGRRAYYLTDGALEIGSRPMAQIPLGPARAGVFVPESAVLWFGGERWVYLARADGGLQRRALPGAADLAAVRGGYVAASGLAAGTRIVTRGAQLLLSQEIRPKDIKTECPDPPECDG